MFFVDGWFFLEKPTKYQPDSFTTILKQKNDFTAFKKTFGKHFDPKRFVELPYVRLTPMALLKSA
jgi:hypothetical protein